MSTIDVIAPPAVNDLAGRADEAGVEFDGANWVEKPVGNKSSAVAMAIGSLLRNAAQPSRAGMVFGSDQAFRCYADAPTKFRKPDVSFVRRESLPADWEEQPMMTAPADLAVEVVSPNDLYFEVDAKVEEYLAAGFGVVWVVNPNTRSVRVHRPDGTIGDFHADDEITGEPFLPAFRSRVAAFFE